MRDLKSIKNAIKNDKDFWRIHEVDNFINAALAQFWGNENAERAIISAIDDSTVSLYLVTDQKRLIVGKEYKTERKGKLFDTLVYEHYANVHELNGVDGNKTRVVVRDTGGFFGKRYYDVIFDGLAQSKQLTLTFTDQSKANAVKQAILDNDKKWSSSTASHNDKGVSSSTSVATGSEIAEIRKMYEDGLIDKAEMIDLIKSLNK